MSKISKIIIFSHNRSGGNLLENIICNNTKVKSFGELLFNRGSNSIHINRNYYSCYDLLKETESYYDKYDILLYRTHTLNGILGVLDHIDNSWYKILLYRDDFIEKLISFTIASHTTKWHFEDKHQLHSYYNFKIFLNKDYVDNLLRDTNSYYNSVLNKFPNIDIIKYSDLIKLNIPHIFSTFNINRDNLKIKTLKISDLNSNRDILINYNDFSDDKYLLKPPFENKV